MKTKRIISVIALLAVLVAVTATVSGCSPAYKIRGVWKLDKVKAAGVEASLPADATLYYCFTKSNVCYLAGKADGKLVSSAAGSYTVDGNTVKLAGLEVPLTFKGKTATLATEVEAPGVGKVKIDFIFTKVSSPSVKDIESATEEKNISIADIMDFIN